MKELEKMEDFINERIKFWEQFNGEHQIRELRVVLKKVRKLKQMFNEAKRLP